MTTQSLKFRLTGVSPLLMHNGQLADPLNHFVKEIKKISGKRMKTDADHAEMARLEWYGGLYLNDAEPCIPAEVMEATFVSAARKSKRGKQATATVFCPENAHLIYDGPKAADELWQGGNHRLTCQVRIGPSRVMRTRPRFNEWAADVEIRFDDTVMNPAEVREIMVTAGESIGLMDWRPRFGRFTVS